MIISASRRTDIPCCYSEWLLNRLRQSFVVVRNPMNHSQLSRIALSPETVDCIVFWTKDPSPMLRKLSEIDSLGYRYYFQFTLTPYTSLEPKLRPKREIIDTFIELSRMLGKKRVVWRYDPIIFGASDGGVIIDVRRHKREFARLCETLCDYTERVTVSIADYYAKLKGFDMRVPTEDEKAELFTFIAETAANCGLEARSCCESDLERFGIKRGGCIDAEIVGHIIGQSVKIPADKNQRPDCLCASSIDIGAYNCCPNGCKYCYANNGELSSLNRYASHDPSSPILIGKISEGERINDRVIKAFCDINSKQTHFNI